MIKNKRTLSLILCVGLLGNPLMANVFDSFGKGFTDRLDINTKNDGKDLGFSNITAPGEIRDGGESTFFGGNIEFRFDNKMNMIKPWLDFEVPGIKAGCNGFSVNGGFASLMDLNDIAEQLGNASGAIVWGLVVGLINSMPTLEHTFSKIKEWIQNIQDMIRNACNFTSKLTQDALKGSSFPKTAQKVFDEPSDLIDKSEDKLKKIFKDKISGTNTSPTDADSEKIAKTFEDGLSVYYFVRGSAGDFLFDKFMLDEKSFKALSDDEKKKKREITEQVIKDDDDISFNYLLFVNIFGESAISPKLNFFYKNYGNVMSDLIAVGKIDTKAKGSARMALKENALEKIATDNVEAAKEGGLNGGVDLGKVLEPKMLPSPIQKVNIINTLLNGNRKKELRLYPIKILYAQVQGKTGAMHNLLAPIVFEDKMITTKWTGLIDMAKEKIRCLVKGNKDKTCGENNSHVTLIVPGTERIVETIKMQDQVEREAKASTNGNFGAQTEDLIQAFARYNAYLYAKFLLQNLMDQKRKNSAGNEVKEEEIKESEIIENTLTSYLEEIKELSIGDLKTIKEFKDFFKELDKDLKEERAKK
ncbi:hypothetical protein BKH42_03650 [Helicobacter sp. 13S00482-2]|uniref:conjugal transfer protein TraH n=1 Tax=Helicobacter sp. 13S00482-2 TaxID=1476200 RepID=UPI000BA712FA|nr:conjugal transfer protein TraH [Helicobacter sp. 13S00482-2]PAF53836.1 hypothetical protein BKH42_03650 [Helicobacter sp. 13S00482-2]